jgi:hypothetical protein
MAVAKEGEAMFERGGSRETQSFEIDEILNPGAGKKGAT